MQWEWIVPIIAVVLWILSNVIRSPEEPPRDVRRRRLPELEQEEQPGAPKPQPPSEVERFLEEINRMRQRTAEEARHQEPRPQPPQPRPAELPRRAQRPPRPRPAQAQPQPRPRAEQRQSSAPLVVRPVRTILPPPPPVPVMMAEVVDVLPVTAPTPAPALAATQVVEAPVAIALRGLINNPHTLAAAIVLNEVLGPPRCRRRVRY